MCCGWMGWGAIGIAGHVYPHQNSVLVLSHTKKLVFVPQADVFITLKQRKIYLGPIKVVYLFLISM